MAKVSLSIKSLNSTDFNEYKVQKLESNNIPFEINDEKIYLISKGTVDVQSRTYNKPYSKFCMQIADSAKEASISMGEGGLDGEKLAILFQVFGWDLEFEIELSCGGEYESGTLITDEDPDTYEMIWVFSVEDSSSQEEDEEIQDFLERADEQGPWSEEDDKIHTVGGLTNDKEQSFNEFQKKQDEFDERDLDKDGIVSEEEIEITQKSFVLNSELKNYLEKKLDDCIADNAGNNEDTVTILEISKENFNKIKNEKNFSNEILLIEICCVRFDDYAGIEPVVPSEVFDEYKKIIQASLNKLSKEEADNDEWDPEYIIHNGFIYCEKKIIILYQLPTKDYNDAESGSRERRYLY